MIDREHGAEQQKAAFTDGERCFAVNMKHIREGQGETMSSLAARMEGLGFAFHPMTVKRIEAGERALRLSEAEAIAHLLGTTVASMTQPPAGQRLSARLERAASNINDLIRELTDLATRTLEAKRELHDAIAAAAAGGLVDERLRRARAVMAIQPEVAVKFARDRLSAESAGERTRDHHLGDRMTKYGVNVIDDQTDLGVPHRPGDRVFHRARHNGGRIGAGTVTRLIDPAEWRKGKRRDGPTLWVAFDDEVHDVVVSLSDIQALDRGKLKLAEAEYAARARGIALRPGSRVAHREHRGTVVGILPVARWTEPERPTVLVHFDDDPVEDAIESFSADELTELT